MAGFLLRLIKGAVIGGGAILPGISGGVLSVLMGVYKPVMAFLANPIRGFRKYASYLLPILIGFAVGTVMLSGIVDHLFRTAEVPAIWLFVGLIVGTLPALYRESGLKGRPRSCVPAAIAGAAIMGGWMFMFGGGELTHVTPTFTWWLLCGALWGVGMIVPGMSPSSFFIFFGLYQPMSAAIYAMDLSVLLPMALGFVATLLLFARAMNTMLRVAYPQVMHFILGIVFASTIAILPLSEPAQGGQIALYAGCFVVGCLLALLMDYVGKKTNQDEEAQ